MDSLLAQTYTVEDYQRRLRLLNYLNSLSLQPYGSSAEKRKSLLREKGADPSDLALFFQLENYDFSKQKTEEVQIFLPFQPELKQIKEICNWLRNNIAENILLKIHYRPNLIAGCSVVWKGRKGNFALTADNKHLGLLKKMLVNSDIYKNP